MPGLPVSAGEADVLMYERDVWAYVCFVMR